MAKRHPFRRFVLVVLVFVLAAGIYNIKHILRAIYPVAYEEDIYAAAQEYAVDPYLIMGIIKAESGFDVHAVSHKDARGLMQLTDETAEWIAEKLGLLDYDVTLYADPALNIRMGCYYVRYLSDLFEYETKTVLEAYNAGPNRVKEWLADPAYSNDGETLTHIPFRETERYVNKVQNYEDVYRRLYSADAPVQ